MIHNVRWETENYRCGDAYCTGHLTWHMICSCGVKQTFGRIDKDERRTHAEAHWQNIVNNILDIQFNYEDV